MNKRNKNYTSDELVIELAKFCYGMIQKGIELGEGSVFVEGYSLALKDILSIIEGADDITPLPENHDLKL